MNWTSHSHNFLKMRSSNGDFTIEFICTRVLVSCSRANFIISFIFFIFLHQEEQNMYVNTAKKTIYPRMSMASPENISS